MKDVMVVSSNASVGDFGLGLSLAAKQIKRIVCSYVGESTSASTRLWRASWS